MRIITALICSTVIAYAESSNLTGGIRLEYSILPKGISETGTFTIAGSDLPLDGSERYDSANRFSLYGLVQITPKNMDSQSFVLVGGGIANNRWEDTYSDPGFSYTDEISSVMIEGHLGIGRNLNSVLSLEALGTLGFGLLSNETRWTDGTLNGQSITADGTCVDILLRAGAVARIGHGLLGVSAGYFYQSGTVSDSGSLQGNAYSTNYNIRSSGFVTSFFAGIHF